MSDFFRTLFENEKVVDVFYSVMIIIGALVAGKILGKAISVIKNRLASRTQTELDDRILETARRPLKQIVYLSGLYFAVHQLDFDFVTKFSETLDGLFFISFAIVLTLLGLRLSNILVTWYLREVAQKTDSDLDDALAPLVGRIIKIILVAISLITVMDYFGIDAKALVVSLGVGSVAIAFAAKETLENMISGFVIMLDRPFRVGDRVRLTSSGEAGDVVSIGLRSTKILNFENTIVIIPNAEIVRAQIINLSYPDPQIRVRIKIGVAYGSNLQRVKQLLEETMKAHPEILDEPPPASRFIEFGESSLDMVVDGRTHEYQNQWRIMEEVRLEIYAAFEKEGIEIPFPQRVLHMAPGQNEQVMETEGIKQV